METQAPAAGRRPRPVVERALFLGTVALALAGGIPLLLSQLSRTSGQTQAAYSFPRVTPAGLVERSGVRVVRVAVSGEGGLLDLRYQVVDAEKAQSVHESATPPLLIDERTGGVVRQLLMGHIHSSPPKVGLTYYLIFNNPGDLVRRGGRVTVQLGDARLAHVPVQ